MPVPDNTCLLDCPPDQWKATLSFEAGAEQRMMGTGVFRTGAGRWVAMLAAAALLAGCTDTPTPAPPPKLPVLTVSDQPVALALNYTARTRGERDVEVRARVSGILLHR